MKPRKLWIASLLVLALLISACAPAAEVPTDTQPPQSTSEPYPVDETPSETESPEDAYPIDETPTQLDYSDIIGGAAYITSPRADFDDIEDHAEDMNEFAVELYRQLASEDGNLVFSPYGIYQAFMMVYAGADGETRAQIADVLDFGDDVDDFDDSIEDVHDNMNALNILLTTPPAVLEDDAQPLEINIANALWLQDNFEVKQDFLDLLSANYNAGLKLVDFSDAEAARQAINLWVAAQTNDKIRDLIPEGVLNELTRLVITNAVYFKGAWQNQFNPDNTSSQSFNLLDGTVADVEMMHHSFTGAALITDDFQAVKLPYEGGNFALAAIMPTGDFSRFESELVGDDDIEDILDEFQGLFGEVTLAMPKFQAESSFNLSEKLRDLGMVRAFDPQAAEFTRITDETELYITDVLHKAFIDVNEEGTEAAAATAVIVGTTSMPADAWEITLDRPFIYVIYETTTNAIVFMGRVVAP